MHIDQAWVPHLDLYTRTRPGVTLLMLETFEVYATSCLVVLFIPKINFHLVQG
jgi:hypothetical protein